MATLFTKIINGEIPAEILYKDDLCVVFKDIQPQAPHHYLLVPIKEIKSIADASNEDLKILGHLMIVARDFAKSKGLDKEGYRLVTNIGDKGGQSVPHLHIHILGGRQMTWPPG